MTVRTCRWPRSGVSRPVCTGVVPSWGELCRIHPRRDQSAEPAFGRIDPCRSGSYGVTSAHFSQASVMPQWSHGISGSRGPLRRRSAVNRREECAQFLRLGSRLSVLARNAKCSARSEHCPVVRAIEGAQLQRQAGARLWSGFSSAANLRTRPTRGSGRIQARMGQQMWDRATRASPDRQRDG